MAAEQVARAQAASQLKSTLSSNFVKQDRQRWSQSEESSVSTIDNTVSVQTETELAALLRPQPQWTRNVGGHFEAVAVGRKSELSEALRLRMQPDLDRWMAAARQVVESPIAQASVAWCSVRPVLRRIQSADREYQAISGVPLVSDEQTEAWKKAADRVTGWAKDRSVMLSSVGNLRAGDKQLLSVIGELPSKQGWAVEVSTGACRDKAGFGIEVRVDAKCRATPLRTRRCEPAGTMVVTRCATGARLAEIPAPDVSGDHPSNDGLATDALVAALAGSDWPSRVWTVLKTEAGGICGDESPAR
jgi:hypothetical protein